MDSHGNPISLARWVRPPTSLLSTSFLQEADFESLTAVNQYQAEPGASQPGGKTGLLPDFWAGWQFVGKDGTGQLWLSSFGSGGLGSLWHSLGSQHKAYAFSKLCSLDIGFSCTAVCPLVRLDIWEKGNISLLQLSERLCSAVRHALCDAIMEFRVLPNPLCVEPPTEPEDLGNSGKCLPRSW